MSDMAPRTYNLMSLCAGVGGLELGVRIARPGARGVCYVEREVPAAARLVARMQDGSLHEAPIWSDLTTFDGRPWRGLVDCLTSGDPCQPNSVAGKQLGRDDDRWILDHVFRIIDEVRPARVFRENVPGNADGQLEAIVPALEGMGYRVAAGIFSARGAGANHLRERLFIMADRDGDGSCSLAGNGLHDDQHHAEPHNSDVEHPISARRAAAGTRPQVNAGCKPRSPSGDVAHAGRSGSPEIAGDAGEVRGFQEAERQPEHGAAVSRGGRPAMGDAIRSGDGRNTADPGRGSVVGTAAVGASGRGVAMADAGGAGLQGIGTGGHAERRQEPDGYAGLEGRTGLLFAPGPSDPAWVEIIRSAPHLAPAVSDAHVAQALILREAEEVGWSGSETQTQSLLRRLDARLAQRVDRLRAGGNGVSSLAAALAWRTLEASLAAGSKEPVRLTPALQQRAAA